MAPGMPPARSSSSLPEGRSMPEWHDFHRFLAFVDMCSGSHKELRSITSSTKAMTATPPAFAQ
jgi:hypothetical protein